VVPVVLLESLLIGATMVFINYLIYNHLLNSPSIAYLIAVPSPNRVCDRGHWHNAIEEWIGQRQR
jgi:hypothetical protein